ncbi:MAG: tRNA 4-thiouridine(8) synthase ThiI [Victivallales bacterium]|nr:tRNA 4-thiouridine(8) synthase ThiI [Victivallales bacterium]
MHPLSNYNIVICRYSEVALKGKNRWRFEKCIIDRLNLLLNMLPEMTVGKIRGRIIIHKQDFSTFSEKECKTVKNALNYVFGIDSFSFCIRTDTDMEAIKAAVYNCFNIKVLSTVDEIKNRLPTFRIRVKRNNKNFSYSTRETEIILGELVSSFSKDLRVDLSDKADFSLFCEVYKNFTLIYSEKYMAQGGLPSGSNQPVLSLLSGGFDSPVASYSMMRRGVFVDFLTFHSYPFTPMETVEKIKRLTAVLNKFQGNRKLFVCNFLETQKTICEKIFENFRTIHYRRIMFRLAEKIAALNGNKALVTGESVGQVASQTIANLSNIDSAIEILVLRPLISEDKIKIMNTAKKIDTFDISKVQTPDSCTVFSPSNPSTNAPKNMILAGDRKMDIKSLIDTAYSNTTVIDVNTNEEIPAADYFQSV